MLRLLVSSLALSSTCTLVASLAAPTLAASHRRAFLQTAGASAVAAIVSSVGILPANAAAVSSDTNNDNATDGGGVPVVVGGKPVYGKEDIMSPKAHGTSEAPVQSELQYGVSNKLADSITNYNRRYAEQAGYFRYTSMEDTIREHSEKTGGRPLTFYDSVTGKPLFVAPVGRSVDQFLEESSIHGMLLQTSNRDLFRVVAT